MRRALSVAAVTIALAGAGVAWYLWLRLFRVEQPQAFDDPVERFFYDSIGGEVRVGFPKYIFEVAPEVCSGLLPGGYESVGVAYLKGHDTPVGFAEKTVGFPRVSFNCATCHFATVRTRPDAEPMIVPGMSPTRFDFERYLGFLFDCLPSESFNPDTVLPAIQKRHSLSFGEALLYRHVIIPKTKDVTRNLRNDYAWMKTRPPFGPGRFDCTNSLRKFFGGDPTEDQEPGVADLPPIWALSARGNQAGMYDGVSTNLPERNRIAALILGATADAWNEPEIEWIEKWLAGLPPPAFPFPIDAALAAKGEPIYRFSCAFCHDARPRTVIPLDTIGTDPYRSRTLSRDTIDRMNNYSQGSFKVRGFVKTNGYLTPMLDGVWARAPYLHNGSVPTLRALLAAPEMRPKRFQRGYDVYDPDQMGFISTGADAERAGVVFDTTVKGNGNEGHRYGVDLGEDEKRALIEYLKKR